MNYKKIFVGILLSSLTFTTFCEPISIDYAVINDYKVRKNKDVWSRLRAGFQLDHTETARVKYFEKMYTKNPKSFERMMENAKPYLYFMLNELERNGLPTELALIPGVESTYNPLAKNPGDAYAGMWQFVPVTGDRFNMLQNSDVDQRRDIIKSTRAAFKYLMYLYSMFGQWDVAIGAYNWGEGGMYKAIVKGGQTVGHVNFQELPLRQITLDYVPKIIALANIIENPSKFGVKLDSSVKDEPFFAVVNPPYDISVSDVQQKSETENTMFSKLNGQYKSSSYTLSKTDNVLLPLPNLMRFYTNTGLQIQYLPPVNEIPDSNNDADTTEQSTQALDDLFVALNQESQTNQPPVKKLNESSSVSNSVAAADEIQDILAAAEQKATTSSNQIKYTVKTGDTLYSICRKFSADIATVKQQNNIPGYNISVGQVLIITPKK